MSVDLAILDALASNGPLQLSGIIAEVESDPNDVLRACKRLVVSGLIQVRITDRRRRHGYVREHHITETGQVARHQGEAA